MRERDHRPPRSNALDLGAERIAARGNLLNAFTSWAAALEQIPRGIDGEDLAARETFVIAVVVLLERSDWFRRKLGEGEPGCARGTNERAGEHERLNTVEQPEQQWSESDSLLLAGCREGKVAAPGVTPGNRPFGGAVAYQQDERWQRRGLLGHRLRVSQ